MPIIPAPLQPTACARADQSLRLLVGCRSRLHLFFVLGIVLTLFSGCAGRVIRASRLHPRYQAATIDNAKIADLGRLSAPASRSDLIEPQDVIDVLIASGIETPGQLQSHPVRISDDGIATIALVGEVDLAGLEPFAAEKKIAEAAVERGLYRTPQVTVTMRKKATNQVTVIGAVEKPGFQQLPRGNSTLLSALVTAGTLNKDAGTKIEIRRHPRSPTLAEKSRIAVQQTSSSVTNSPESDETLDEPAEFPAVAETFRIDLAKVSPDGENDFQLQDGDIVRVETRDPPPLVVIGLVNKPGQFPMPVNQQLRVLDALALAGERSNSWADRIVITRRIKNESEPVVISTSIRSAQRNEESNLRLAPGDVVSVEQTPQTVSLDIFKNFFRLNVIAGGSIPLF